MKKFIKSVLLWAAVMCLMPLAVRGNNQTQAEDNIFQSEAVVIPTDKLKIYTSDGEIRTVTVEEYTVYAVLKEIPFTDEPEAVKAQACAARTYAVRRILAGEDSTTGAHISDDESKYQTCLTDNQARKIYGDNYAATLAAAQSAADATRGKIIAYNGIPACAPFHLSSGEYTLSSESAWGKALPYLTAVKNPDGSCEISEKTFTRAELYARISADFPAASELHDIALSYEGDTAAVNEASLCGITISGNALARLLSLESRAFSVTNDGDTYTFTVTGSGHLAGMSMTGAYAMAQSGSDYREILSHYYTGTEILDVMYSD